MIRLTCLLLISVRLCSYVQATVIDDFTDGVFNISADNSKRAIGVYQSVPSIPGHARQLYLGSFLKSPSDNAVVTAAVQGGSLGISSNVAAEGFELTYGALDGQVGPTDNQVPLNFDVRDGVFTIEFDQYVPASLNNKQSICVGLLSGLIYQPTVSVICNSIDSSRSPFSVSIAASDFQGITLSDIDQLVVSIGGQLESGGHAFAASSFGIRSVKLERVPEPQVSIRYMLVLVNMGLLAGRRHFGAN